MPKGRNHLVWSEPAEEVEAEKPTIDYSAMDQHELRRLVFNRIMRLALEDLEPAPSIVAMAAKMTGLDGDGGEAHPISTDDLLNQVNKLMAKE